MVAYTFVGYPAIIAVLARLCPRPVRRDDFYRPTVSFIIAAHNEADVIEAKLRDTLELEYPHDRLDLVVVADGSEDATAARAARFEGVRVLYERERRGKLAAMLRGVEQTDGEILIFSDANNRYTRDALLELTSPFADPAVGVVTGRKAIDDGTGRPLDQAEGLYWRYESKLKEWESAAGSVTAASGEILAFRRRAFPRLPFDALVEDLAQILLAALQGWRVVYAPRAVSLEPASATIDDESTRRTRLVAGRWQVIARVFPLLVRRQPRLAWQLASHKLTRPIIPAALVVFAASNLSLARESRWGRAVAAAHLGFYLAAVHGWIADRSGRRNRVTYLPYYFCRMNIATAQAPLSLLARRQKIAWTRVKRG